MIDLVALVDLAAAAWYARMMEAAVNTACAPPPGWSVKRSMPETAFMICSCS